MADFCSLKDSYKYKQRQEMSGIDKDEFDIISKSFVDVYDRLPHLDEIECDSSNYLKEKAKINDDGYSKKEDIHQYTGEDNAKDAQIKINNLHEDLIVTLDEKLDHYKVNIKHRPTKVDISDLVKPERRVSNGRQDMTLDYVCDKIRDLYGVEVELTNTNDILMMGIPEGIVAKGFVYNGKIYINKDLASVHTPVHELLHLIMGTLKAHNRELYNTLCGIMSSNEGFAYRSMQYTNRSMNDLLEEELVEQTARMIFGGKSAFDNMSSENLSEFSYLLNRAFDTVLDGKYSVNSGDWVYEVRNDMTLFDLMQDVRSRLFEPDEAINLDVYDSKYSRELENLKSKLFKENLLKEDC